MKKSLPVISNNITSILFQPGLKLKLQGSQVADVTPDTISLLFNMTVALSSALILVLISISSSTYILVVYIPTYLSPWFVLILMLVSWTIRSSIGSKPCTQSLLG